MKFTVVARFPTSGLGLLIVGALSLWQVAGQPGDSRQTRPPSNLVVEGRREPTEASVSTRAMKYLPFDVPDGVTRLVIHKEFDHGPDTTQRNTVDFGLFDPRGNPLDARGHLLAEGFRGWQGGIPDDFILAGTVADSSPHAIPGAIPAGRWHIAQYFLKSTPSGLTYKYTITFHFDGIKPPKTVLPVPKYEPGTIRKGAAWYTGNLHSHTIHSDGGRTLNDLVTRNEKAGFDFLASTEHNSPTAHYHFTEVGKAHPNHLLLFGDEFTSPSGHANIIGQKPGYFFDFRIDGGDGRLPKLLNEVHSQKAFFVVNHPFAPCTSCPWLYPESEWTGSDAIEVWNGVWTPDDRKAVDLWDKHLKAGRRLVASGGTDYHRGEDALVPAVKVFARELSRDAILDGLRHGRVFLTETPGGPQLYLTATNGKTLPGDTIKADSKPVVVALRVVGGAGKSLRFVHATGEETLKVTGEAVTLTFAVPPPTGGQQTYIRAELVDELGRVSALTNPIFVRSDEMTSNVISSLAHPRNDIN